MDRDLLGSIISDRATFPAIVASGQISPGVLDGGQTMLAATINGSKDYPKITSEEGAQSVVPQREDYQWSGGMILALILDFITVACILWLLGR